MRSAMLSVLACLGLFLASVASGFVGPLAAQDICDSEPHDKCDLGPTGYHSFPSNGTGWDYTCTWEGCHETEKVGHCGDKHYRCWEPVEEEEEDADVAQVRLILDALTVGDHEAAVASFRAAWSAGVSSVQFNPARGAWQLLSCNGTSVVAHLPLKEVATRAG